MRRPALPLAVALCLLISTAAIAAPADPTYTALRAIQPDGRTIALNNFVYERDVLKFTLNGTLHLLTPVEGKTSGAVFTGQGSYELKPAAVAEQMYAISKKSVRFLNRQDAPIGFMSDDQVKEQQAAEARGDEPVDEGGDDEATEGEESAPAEAAAEGTPSPEGGSEPTQS